MSFWDKLMGREKKAAESAQQEQEGMAEDRAASAEDTAQETRDEAPEHRPSATANRRRPTRSLTFCGTMWIATTALLLLALTGVAYVLRTALVGGLRSVEDRLDRRLGDLTPASTAGSRASTAGCSDAAERRPDDDPDR